MTAQETREIAMYGMTAADIQEQYINSLTARLSGQEMVIASVLSDCQELIEMGNKELVRKQLNVAKYILFNLMDSRRDEEMVLVNSDGKEIV